jgi:hypothetical protein
MANRGHTGAAGMTAIHAHQVSTPAPAANTERLMTTNRATNCYEKFTTSV